MDMYMVPSKPPSYNPTITATTLTHERNKKGDHKTKATWTNCLGGDMYWPTAKRVAIEQQEQASWKGKLVPTN